MTPTTTPAYHFGNMPGFPLVPNAIAIAIAIIICDQIKCVRDKQITKGIWHNTTWYLTNQHLSTTLKEKLAPSKFIYNKN
ncbi:hypothetical protein CR513_56794, partial [Mucuna pruriens]